MKKLRISIISGLGLFLIGILVCCTINASMNDKGKMAGLGQLEYEQYEDNNSPKAKDKSSMYCVAVEGAASDELVTYDEVYEAGSDVIVTFDELERAQLFFEQQGNDSKDAEEMAVEYMEEYNAMYAEAIANGYDVSDSELKDYIQNLKVDFENCNNSEELKKEIEQFESEEDFWKYQETIYKKKLPVQKYVAALEKEFNEGTTADIFDNENTNLWNEELDEIKKRASKKQQYKRVKTKKDIHSKFKR